MMEQETKKSKGITYIIKRMPTIDGEYVKTLRKKLGLSQAMFATLMRVSNKTVEKWEQGRNPVTNGNAVAMVLFDRNPSLMETFISVEEMSDKKPDLAIKSKTEEPIVSEFKLAEAK